jgi:hypothetical protein
VQCFDVLLSDVATADGTLEMYFSEDGYLNKHTTGEASAASPSPSKSSAATPSPSGPAHANADVSAKSSGGLLSSLSRGMSSKQKLQPPPALMGRWHWSAAELRSAPHGMIALVKEPLDDPRHAGAHVSLELQLFRLTPAGLGGLSDQVQSSVPTQGWAHVRAEQKVQSLLKRVFSHSKNKAVESFMPSRAAPIAAQETAAWLNHLLEALWPSICEYSEDLIRSFEPMIKSSLPSFLGSVSFSTVSLGKEPLSFDNFAVSRTDAGEVRLEMDLKYDGDSDIQLVTMAGSLGIKTLRINGRLTIIMGPIFASWQFMKAIQARPMPYGRPLQQQQQSMCTAPPE